jgi:exodeoxyribonuclease VII large subunit
MRETPAPEQPIQSGTPGAGPRILAVGDLTRLVRETLQRRPDLRDVWVEGEVGQVTVSSAGHCYFTLKDERAQLRCMIFRDDRLMMPFEARTGLRLVAHGRIDVFEPQGAYQLYVDSIQPAGFGDLALRFEALKAKLAAEGLFEQGRKRPLPTYPLNIGLVTSLSGAVLHDVGKVIARRWPMARVIVSACQVQGQSAAPTIVGALRRIARWTDGDTGRRVDLVILARGGGSLEDLWPFNEEEVVRAIAAHPAPVVVGVGHETDVTLAEFAADVRAATPSVAAELAVPSRTDELLRVGGLAQRLHAAGKRTLLAARQQVNAEQRALEGHRPQALLAAERERAGMLLDRAVRIVGAGLERRRADLLRTGEVLAEAAVRRLGRARAALERETAAFVPLSPYATLERGYAIVRDERGAILREASRANPGERLAVRLHRGALDARVEKVRDSDDD